MADALRVGALSLPDPEQEVSQPARRHTPLLLAAAPLLTKLLRKQPDLLPGVPLEDGVVGRRTGFPHPVDVGVNRPRVPGVKTDWHRVATQRTIADGQALVEQPI